MVLSATLAFCVAHDFHQTDHWFLGSMVDKLHMIHLMNHMPNLLNPAEFEGLCRKIVQQNVVIYTRNAEKNDV